MQLTTTSTERDCTGDCFYDAAATILILINTWEPLVTSSDILMNPAYTQTHHTSLDHLMKNTFPGPHTKSNVGSFPYRELYKLRLVLRIVQAHSHIDNWASSFPYWWPSRLILILRIIQAHSCTKIVQAWLRSVILIPDAISRSHSKCICTSTNTGTLPNWSGYYARLTLKLDEDVKQLDGHESRKNLNDVAVPVSDIYQPVYWVGERWGKGDTRKMGLLHCVLLAHTKSCYSDRKYN